MRSRSVHHSSLLDLGGKAPGLYHLVLRNAMGERLNGKLIKP